MQILQALIRAWTFAERPQILQHIPRYATSLVRHTDDNMLRRLAHRNFNRRYLSFKPSSFLLLNNCLDGVSKQLADDVFEMRENVWECGIQVARELDLRQDGGGAVSCRGESSNGVETGGYDIFGVAF